MRDKVMFNLSYSISKIISEPTQSIFFILKIVFKKTYERSLKNDQLYIMLKILNYRSHIISGEIK